MSVYIKWFILWYRMYSYSNRFNPLEHKSISNTTQNEYFNTQTKATEHLFFFLFICVSSSFEYWSIIKLSSRKQYRVSLVVNCLVILASYINCSVHRQTICFSRTLIFKEHKIRENIDKTVKSIGKTTNQKI